MVVVDSEDHGRGFELTQQFYNSNYFRSVEFFDEQVGFAGTLSSALFRTEDGGATWGWDISASLPTVPAGICGMSVADDTTIYLTGIFCSPAYIMRSTASWNDMDTHQHEHLGVQPGRCSLQEHA